MEPNTQPQDNLSPKTQPQAGFLGFIKKHWFLLFLATFATLLLILWFDSRRKEGEAKTLPNLPQIAYLQVPGLNISTNVSVTLPASVSLPTNVVLYQTKPRSLTRDQAKLLASNFAFPKEPSNISTDPIFGDNYLWLSGAQALSIRLSPFELNMSPDFSETSPPSEGVLPTEQAGLAFIKNILSLNGLLDQNIDYSKTLSRPVMGGNVLEVGMAPQIEGVPVVDTEPTTPLVIGYLQKDGKLYGLIYKAGFENPTSPALYPAKTLKEIHGALVSEGKIVSLGKPEGEGSVLVPTTVSISTIIPSLLFMPEQPMSLLPIYAMMGVARTDQGEVPIHIYIPSVNSKYVRAL